MSANSTVTTFRSSARTFDRSAPTCSEAPVVMPRATFTSSRVACRKPSTRCAGTLRGDPFGRTCSTGAKRIALRAAVRVAGLTSTDPSDAADSSASAPVQSTSLLPTVALEKQLIGPVTAHIGQQVQYRIRYTNASPNVFARAVVVVDTLPAGLTFVSSVPAATVSGSILTWTMGDQSPASVTDTVTS